MNNRNETITLFQKIISETPKAVKKFVQKQGDMAVQITSILKNKGIKQKEFAKQIGMKEPQLSKILAGNANCTLKTITKIEAALDEDIITVPMFTDKKIEERIIISPSISVFDLPVFEQDFSPYSQGQHKNFELNINDPQNIYKERVIN